MKIQKNRWYRVLCGGAFFIVRIDDRIMKYCIVDYYDGRLWFTGSCQGCKKFIMTNLVPRYDKNGGYHE